MKRIKTRINSLPWDTTITYYTAFTLAAFCVISMILTGCNNYTSEEISIETESEAETEIEIADEFELVYRQNAASIYRHLPTDMMYVWYNGKSFVPMNLTWEEYSEKSKAFHEANDKIVTKEEQTAAK